MSNVNMNINTVQSGINFGQIFGIMIAQYNGDLNPDWVMIDPAIKYISAVRGNLYGVQTSEGYRWFTDGTIEL